MYFKLNVKRGVKSNRQPSQLKHVTQPSPVWRHVPTDIRWETKVTTAAQSVDVNRSVPRARPIQSSCRRWTNATTAVLNHSKSSLFRRRRSVRITAVITLVLCHFLHDQQLYYLCFARELLTFTIDAKFLHHEHIQTLCCDKNAIRINEILFKTPECTDNCGHHTGIMSCTFWSATTCICILHENRLLLQLTANVYTMKIHGRYFVIKMLW